LGDGHQKPYSEKIKMAENKQFGGLGEVVSLGAGNGCTVCTASTEYQPTGQPVRIESPFGVRNAYSNRWERDVYAGTLVHTRPVHTAPNEPERFFLGECQILEVRLGKRSQTKRGEIETPARVVPIFQNEHTCNGQPYNPKTEYWYATDELEEAHGD
jgi:hypothetical protein